MQTKIEISPEMREFNDAVQVADDLTDGSWDNQPASVLLAALRDLKIYPHCAKHLAEAMANIAVKR